MTVAVLSGGVGAARLLGGLVQVADPASITAIVNTGDDVELHGLHVSPDLDTITYTLAGAIDPERGWGLAGETWTTMQALARFGAARPAGSTAGGTWFGLGDQDLATHLYRTHRLQEGGRLTDVTAEIARAYGVAVHLLPVTDEPVRTMVQVAGEGEVGFQDYFVRRRHQVPITGVRFEGVALATVTPEVTGALGDAELIVIAPSNPIVSIGPVLAVPGVRELVEAARSRVVAVSPIVGGRALKGPADRMLSELGHPVSVTGIARIYRDLASALVIDTSDGDLADEVEAEGIRCIVTDTVMRTAEVAAALGRTLLTGTGSW